MLSADKAPRIKRPIINPRLIPLLLLWLAGACLRITVLATPPVTPLLHADLHLSETQIGWLSSLPPMLFAIAAVPGSLLIARVGLIPALLVGLSLTALGGAARGAIPDATFLFASTVVMAAGVAIMQPILPPLVRAWFPARIGFATAVYTTGLLIGEILPAALTIPLVLPLIDESWRLSFVVWTIPVLLTAVVVAVYAKRRNDAGNAAPAANTLWWPDWRRPLIWQIGLILGSVNAIYFVSNAFLPDYVIAQGRPDLVGAALTALNVGQLPAAFLMLGLAGSLVTRPWAYAVSGLASLLALIGMVMSHGVGIVVFAGLLGFTDALTLILALALPLMLSAPDDVHRTSAGMFTISYSCAMLLSIVGGWLWDLTAMPVASFAPVALCAIVIVVLASTVKNARQ
ncbi:MAG TPA: MFS transporter [Xanthobacteraceae bacterium]|nr:MFS transporter [Xanthobacteraceae bacterium]